MEKIYTEYLPASVPDETPVHDVFTETFPVRGIDVLDIAGVDQLVVLGGARPRCHVAHEHHWVLTGRCDTDMSFLLEHVRLSMQCTMFQYF